MTEIEDKVRPGQTGLARFVTAFLAESKSAWFYAKRASGARDDYAKTPRLRHEDEHGFPLPSTRPYPGLRAFTPSESRLFFGRQAEAADLRKKLADSNIVVVLGGSGSGKSSLVLAGVLPRLNDVGRIPGRTGRWYTATFRPGDAPCARLVDALLNDVCEPLLALEQGPRVFAECLREPATTPISLDHIRASLRSILAPDGRFAVAGIETFLDRLDAIDERLAALRGSGRSGPINLFLLVDQLEELFRGKDMQGDIAEIVKLLDHAKSNPRGPLVVVATLRSEELHRCSEIDGLAPIVNTGFYLVDRPSIAALVTAAVNPGRQTLSEWDVDMDAGSATAPFTPEYIAQLKMWIERFQSDDQSVSAESGRRRRHQADLLPLFQHLLRISWGTAAERWKGAETAAVELQDIVSWVNDRRPRVEQFRTWMKGVTPVRVEEKSHDPDNMLEACFDTAVAITLSEAVSGQDWRKLDSWPAADETFAQRLRLAQAAFVSLATRDDKGNDARRPASAEEIMAASSRAPDADTLAMLEDVLDFIKARDYIRGGAFGERYDVSHEALIRNSTEYQAWLDDAKEVSRAFHKAVAALPEGGTDNWLDESRNSLWSRFKLARYREAAERITDDLQIKLECVFGPDAVYDARWVAERAEPGKSPEEYGKISARVRSAWEDAYRWRVDFSAGGKYAVPLRQRIMARLEKLSSELALRLEAAVFQRQPQEQDAKSPVLKAQITRPGVISGQRLWRFRKGLMFVLSPLAAIALTVLVIQNYRLNASQAKLQLLAVIGDAAYARQGPANDVVRNQIIASGHQLKKLSSAPPSTLMSGDHAELAVASATFDGAVRSYLSQIFIRDLPSAPAGSDPKTPLTCIKYEGQGAVRGHDAFASGDGRRSFKVIEGDRGARIVPFYEGRPAELIPGETTNVLSGRSIVCGGGNLDYLFAWPQLSDISAPVLLPVNWFMIGEKGPYARVDEPFLVRSIGGDDGQLAKKLTAMGKAIADKITDADFSSVTARNDDGHWTTVTVGTKTAGNIEVRFAQGVRSPMIVSAPPSRISECEQPNSTPGQPPVPPRWLKCGAPGKAGLTIELSSQAFDLTTRSGRSEAPIQCMAQHKHCVHDIKVTYPPTKGASGQLIPINRTTISTLTAPPITHAGFWENYLVLRDQEGTHRSTPIQVEALLGLTEKLPAQTTTYPTSTICDFFACNPWRPSP